MKDLTFKEVLSKTKDFLRNKKVPLIIGVCGISSFLMFQNFICGRAQYSFENAPANDAARSTASGNNGNVSASNTQQKEEVFSLVQSNAVTIQVPAPMDLLWVVDNSPSMQNDQSKISASFQAFSNRYLNVQRDLRVARITTDAYKAGSGDADCAGKTFCNPNNSLLVAGWADGTNPPIPGMTRSGVPIISTRMPSDFVGSLADWNIKITHDFDLNVNVGTLGHRIEKGMQSLHTFFNDNEALTSCHQPALRDPRCFFRKNTVRGIVILTDEKDSSLFTGAPRNNVLDDSVVSYNVDYFKNYLDSFFRTLDVNSANPNYFVTAIVNPDTQISKAYRSLVDKVKADPTNAAALASESSDITQANYDTILDKIGQTVSETTIQTTVYSSFALAEVPVSFGDLAVYAVDANDVGTLLDQSSYVLIGNELKLTSDILTLMPATVRIKAVYNYEQ